MSEPTMLNDTPAGGADTPSGADTMSAGADTPAGGADTLKGDEGAPEKYEFKFDDGVKIDDAIMTEFSGIAKEMNLSQANAQKLANFYAAKMTAHGAAQEAAWAATVKEWGDQVRTDKEIGGANLDANIALARKVLDRHGSPELRQMLDTTGAGNHPALVRLLVKVGKDMGEDAIQPGGGDNKGSEVSAAKRLYPNHA